MSTIYIILTLRMNFWNLNTSHISYKNINQKRIISFITCCKSDYTRQLSIHGFAWNKKTKKPILPDCAGLFVFKGFVFLSHLYVSAQIPGLYLSYADSRSLSPISKSHCSSALFICFSSVSFKNSGRPNKILAPL